MKSRMSLHTGSGLLFLTGIFFTFMIVLSAASCATQDKEHAGTDLIETSAGNNTTPDDNAVTGDNILKDTGPKEFSDAEFVGVYKLTGDPICSITLSIKKDSDGYSYSFNGGITSSGRIGLEKKEGAIYVYFNGTRCGGNKESASGIYTDKKIIIQKSGNSMSHNACFRECDSKYLRFVKN